ncbi:hypothetical protein SAMD00019534_118780 [Acytostelium subglobosum LB1]|uniref:hypothetical protein n=1 Tax=Acytostelium subglobosum LB1 TaxID=1410327 RepID=UPI000645007F|nr:hypothetical protein SAMD00019534_118780 [Acytostelium subglobosum LB1]GAM28702.1 hypothetical protein SAMD00019534_118780 [Acytostelium subglobosum LB1]|eukprot:XP_012748480.1 hypothetical protein SAMD00019534_118780 [Acytostelium subglobosum LB1]
MSFLDIPFSRDFVESVLFNNHIETMYICSLVGAKESTFMEHIKLLANHPTSLQALTYNLPNGSSAHWGVYQRIRGGMDQLKTSIQCLHINFSWVTFMGQNHLLHDEGNCYSIYNF